MFNPVRPCIAMFASLVLASCVSSTDRANHPPLRHFDSTQVAQQFVLDRVAAKQRLKAYQTAEMTGDDAAISTADIAADQALDTVKVISSPPLKRFYSLASKQEPAVDEGDIVKRVGDILVILREGRLYTIHLGSTLEKRAELSIQEAGFEHDAWYHELLVQDGYIVVVGNNYDLGGIEYKVFTLGDDGAIARGNTQLIKRPIPSSETGGQALHSTEARLVDGKLVLFFEGIDVINDYDADFYGDSYFDLHELSLNSVTGMLEGYPLFSENTVYAPLLDSGTFSASIVATCPLGTEQLSCTASTILGGFATGVYVSEQAFYLWDSGYEWDFPTPPLTGNTALDTTDLKSVIYRIDLATHQVGAIGVDGEPLDSFSMRERNGRFEFVSSDYDADESFYGAVDISRFNGDVYQYPKQRYIKVSSEEGSVSDAVNRFIGNHLVYVDHPDRGAQVNVLNLETRQLAAPVTIEAGVETLQAVGDHALALGETDDYQRFVGLITLGKQPQLSSWQVEDIFENEYASHVFSLSPKRRIFARSIDVAPDDTAGHQQTYSQTLYTQIDDDFSLRPLGNLLGNPAFMAQFPCEDDVCNAWFQTARSIFWNDRVFLVSQYELIEAVLVNDALEEVSRLTFGRY